MRKLLLFAMTAVFVVPNLNAQEVEYEYFYSTSTLLNDSTRAFGQVPIRFSTRDWIGFGQIFAPSVAYEWFDPIYDVDSKILYDPDQNPNNLSDQDYIDQFMGNITEYTVDSIGFFVYNNPDNTPVNGGVFGVYKTDVDFGAPAYRTTLFSKSMQELDTLAEVFISPDELVEVYNPVTNQITRTIMDFTDPQEFPDPLTFSGSESMVYIYYNPFATPTTNTGTGSTAEYQVIPAFQEYRVPNAQNPDAPRGDSVAYYKTGAVTLYRIPGDDGSRDTVRSAYITLQIGNQDPRRALLNLNSFVWGRMVVDTASGVELQFGYDAKEQGLANITPNPVTDGAKIPFSLTRVGTVTLELFSTNGKQVATLIDGQKYIPGKYTVPVPTDDLQNGGYVVRMRVDGEVYSQKFTVAR